MPKPARDQAQSFVRNLVKKLGERGIEERLRFAVCTALPETPYSNPPSHGNLDGAVLGQQDLGYLREALTELRDRLFDPQKIPEDTRWIDALHDLWGDVDTAAPSRTSRRAP